tara:strand:- start:434 stop:1366 length:933 start_codon:yes stop_codon:yes gene_type:complete
VPKLTRKRTLLCKTESSYGTDPTPTAGSNGVLVRDLNIEPVQSDEVSRDLIRPYLGNYETLLANTRVNVTCDVEMVGSGSAGTEPAYNPLLKACGLAVTTVSSTSNTYAPVSTSFGSCTIYCNIDGVRHKVTGCRGTFSINCSVNEIPIISFSMTGIYNAPTDQAVPAPTFNATKPLLFKNGNTSAFSLFGYGGVLQNWSFDMNNEVVYRELVGGTKEVMITNRTPSGSVSVEAVALSAHNFFTDATGSSTGTNTFLHGTTAGNKVTLSCPQTDLGQPTYEDSDGVQLLNLPFVATPTTAGNNELSIAYT